MLRVMGESEDLGAKTKVPKQPETTQDFERPLVGPDPSRRFGWMAALAALSVVGLVAWFLMSGTDEI